MSIEIRIDTRFLKFEQFKREDGRLFEKAYRKVFEKIIDLKVLPYVPTLYIFPYILVDIVPTSKEEGIRSTSFAMQSVDPSAPTERLAIFAPVYLNKLPFQEIVYSLAHEIAHFVRRKGSVESALEEIKRKLRMGSLGMRESIEKAATETYDIFKEPFKTQLIESDRRMARGEYRKVREGARIMKRGEFMAYILGERFPDFIKYVEEKLKPKRS
jgi:hypothetical protein